MRARKKFNNKPFIFIGRDTELSRISDLDGTLELSYKEKFALICELTLFEYQLKNQTNDIPRFLRTTACIRKT